MAEFNLTTTGTQDPVVISSLELSLAHPTTTDLIADEGFTLAEIMEAMEIQDLIDAGHITVTDENTDPITYANFLKIAGDIGNGTILTTGSTGISGSFVSIFRDNTIQNNSTTSMVNALTANPVLEVADYLITVSYMWNHNAVQNDFEAEFLIGGVSYPTEWGGAMHTQEPKDAAGNISGTSSNQAYPFYTQIYYSNAVAGAVSMALNFRSDVAGIDSNIWNIAVSVQNV